MPADASRAAHDSLAGATSVAQTLPDQVGAALIQAARTAFTDGLHVAATISAVLLLGLAICVVTMLRRIPPIGAEQPADAAEPVGAPDLADVTS